MEYIDLEGNTVEAVDRKAEQGKKNRFPTRESLAIWLVLGEGVELVGR